MSESETTQSSTSLTLESLMKVIEAMYDHDPELPVEPLSPQEYFWRRGCFPIVIDPTLPDDTIKMGDATLTNIKKD